MVMTEVDAHNMFLELDREEILSTVWHRAQVVPVRDTPHGAALWS
jgi:hypothetical protein